MVVTYISYCGISGDLDNLYTDKLEAEAEATRHNDFPVTLGCKLKYSVMSLYDYIDELKSEARDLGRNDERERLDNY